jgi:hypothetical protein
MLPVNPKVFISHASEDKERFVLDFAAKLRSKGVKAWVDRWELLPGDSLVRKIFDEGIGQAEAVIVVISEHSVNKPWVREELDVSTVRKIEDGIRLIPVLIGDVTKEQIPQSLRATLWERINDLDDYEAELARIVDVVYGRRKKPALGQRPGYTSDDLYTVPGLSRSDSLILRLCCEREIELGHRGALVDPKDVIPEAERADLHQEQAVESMEILDGRGYLQATHTLGTIVPYSLKVTDFGFNEYGHAYIPDYDSLIRSVGLQIANHDMLDSDAIAEALDRPLTVVEHVLGLFEIKGYIRILRETGLSLTIGRASPELKRWLRET